MNRILFFIFLCTSFSLQAQIKHGKDDDQFRIFDVGLIAGFNASQVDGDNLAGFYKMGLNTGGVAHINFNEDWSLSFEILFTQKGARTRPDPDAINVYKLTMNYAEVPVAINYNDQNRFIFSAGLGYGRLFKVVELINGLDNNNDDAFYSDEVSYHFGGTILIGEEKHFGVNFRYQGSITAVGQSLNPTLPGAINRLLSFRGIYYF
ncbi:MAG: PorT family protein [Fimbriimonadaceae bacterium]|nr:PorT family protein [Chitinophagales bacterium]